MGTILYNGVVTGIYATNSEDACIYQVQHSEAEVVVVENFELLSRFSEAQLPGVKAYVVWGEKSIPEKFDRSKVYLWADFMNFGKDISDEIIYQ